ncbi:hypothetical protein DL764_006732 [Monosporascus ibericus]|uniref:Uncharacterized protein n=1 Tax=Monosporascus ibericus TaxID=155417 RepID=A0A4Q4T417_9PEZI|nr:hypothetical protein DL764_006732 [Monosporascus ibericus]
MPGEQFSGGVTLLEAYEIYSLVSSESLNLKGHDDARANRTELESKIRRQDCRVEGNSSVLSAAARLRKENRAVFEDRA